MTTIAPYGSWTSPITAQQAAEVGRPPQWTGFVGDEVWWVEPRSTEGGRYTVVRQTPDGPQELLPAPWNARNRVHEYGGQPWTAVDGTLVFTNWDDQRVYAVSVDEQAKPRPLTPEPDRPHGYRYSDLQPGLPGEAWMVRETVTGPHPTDVVRDLVAVTLTGEVRRLGASHHFMTAPHLSPDGRLAAWIGWDHPNMPWDSTELVVAEVQADGTFGPHRVVAGGRDVSVCQVAWDADGSLLALMDPDGWWNLHRLTLSADGMTTKCLFAAEEEHGGPLWTLGLRWFAPLGGEHAGKYVLLRKGRPAVLDPAAGTLTDVDVDLPSWAPSLAARGGRIAGVAAGPKQLGRVVTVDLDAGSAVATLSHPTTELPPAEYLPEPQERFFSGPDGDVPAFVYPPTNPDFAAPEGELPPYVVHVHGGPTSAVSPTADLQIAYLTSRGIGVVAVNYGGSTGYGRAFRNRLRGNWGVVDVADCEAVAKALAAEGTADGKRLGIRGGSAGGYTSALSAVTCTTYAAATIMFPVIDMLGFVEGGTHDFESQYLFGLVGTLPEDRQKYVDRSPITHTDSLACPVLLLQGLEDEVCPPEQAQAFVDAIRGRGIPHAYVAFEGEQHGFRRAESIVTALESELSFYGQVFGFEPAGVPTLRLER
ncbi:prolyl oligopeptidase family serine peptidase [Thermocrispum sp.]|uniref:Prolyl oligopeptidase family serine peptidase n=1 Tax=Thermocrispum agreste TaxID=37925 RepID=A0ABD6FCK2_9PSEU|nr:prolyl oligopeptidase family serine peptidase [Thermocrispum sp.]